MTHRQAPWRNRLNSFNHRLHIIPAIFLASLLFIVEQSHWLDWIDVAMLRISQQQQPFASAAEKSDQPLVLALTDEYYETESNQSSPLNRAALKKTLSQILAKQPGVLAIDLDLSPSPEPDANQIALDQFLLDARTASPNTRIIIITPFVVATAKAFDSKAQWMARLCQAGIAFASPTLLVQQGAVLKFDHKAAIPTLGQAAARKENSEVCQMVLADGKLGFGFALDDVTSATQVEKPAYQPINYGYFDSARPLQVSSINLVENAIEAGQTVFLGGAFGNGDYHLTPYGEVPGVLIHAAIAFSTERPITPAAHALAVALDILIGVILGQVFSRIWKRHFDAKADPRRAPVASLWLLANFGILGIAIMTVVASAAKLLSWGVWLNPAPMLLGMFIDTLLTKEPQADHESHPPARLARKTPDWLDLIVYAKHGMVIIVIATASILLLIH